jgi:hypothetical protein
VSFAEFFEAHMGRVDLEANTRALSGAEAERYVLPAFRSRRLSAISRDDVEDFIADLRDRGVGVPTIQVCYRPASHARRSGALRQDRREPRH